MFKKSFALSLLILLSVQASATDPPFEFYENKGQWNSDVHFAGSLNGGKIFLTKNGILYNFYDTEAIARLHGDSETNLKHTGQAYNAHSLQLSFIGATPETVKGSLPNNVKYNFFLGNDQSQWASDVRAYGNVHYNNLYPGIDLKYYASDGHLKYDYIVKPGADPELIRVAYNGANRIYLENQTLYIKTSVNEIIENKPFAYQLSGSDTIVVPCDFRLIENELSYIFPEGYNNDLPLIIDPILIFSSYSGSYADNWGNTATYDTLGNLYSGGIVFNNGYPSTVGAYQTNFNGVIDIGILKYDSSGSNLHYATYLGGNQTEIPMSLVVNNKNELLIVGVTSSHDFPTSDNAFQKIFRGGKASSPMGGVTFSNGSDLFITKLSEDGSTLLASTLIGGSSNDGMMLNWEELTVNYGDQFRADIIFDENDDLYIATHTESNDFPLVSAFDLVYNGGRDALVFKLSDDLSTLLFSSYLGGAGADAAFSIKLDKDNLVYVAGGTNSTNFPTTTGVYKPSKSTDDIDGFVSVIDLEAGSLVSSTYIGTSSYDQVYFLDLDQEENIYVLGQTMGPIPVTNNVYSNPNSGQFIQKYSNDLKELKKSTVFGSGEMHPNISPTAFLVNTCGSIFITGWGGNTNGPAGGYVGGYTFNLPITPDAFQQKTDGSDFYMMVISEDISQLLYATYFGGNHERGEHVDGGTSRFDKRGIVYQAVCAGCGGNSQFPTTPGAWSNTNNSENCNNAAFKYDLSTLKAYFTTDKVAGCAPLTVNFKNLSFGGETHTWDFDGDIRVTMVDSLTYTFTEPGEYLVTLTVEDYKTCIGKDVASKIITVHDGNFSISPSDTVCLGDNIQLYASGGTSYQWEPGDYLNNPNSATPICSPQETTNYVVNITNQYGCEHKDSVTITVDSKTKVDFDIITEHDCEHTPIYHFVNNSIGVNEFVWDLGDENQSTEESPTYEYTTPGSYNVILKGIGNKCATDKQANVQVGTTRVPNVFTPNQDDKNEYFFVESSEEISLSIYDRWGKPVYESSPYYNDWTGGNLPTGVYYYEIVFENADVCKGWLHLLK